MLLVDDVRDHDVAYAPVQRRRLPQHIDTAQRPGADRHFAQDVVGAEAERIVDIDQYRGAALQPICRRISQAPIDVTGHQPVEDDHLRRDVEASLAGKEEDATLAFFSAALRPSLFSVGRLPVIRASRVIEEVIPVSSRLALA